MLTPEEVNICKAYLSKGELSNCLTFLARVSERFSIYNKEISLFSSRWEQLARDFHKGLINFDVYEQRRNAICEGLLNLVNNSNIKRRRRYHPVYKYLIVSSIMLTLMIVVTIFASLYQFNSDLIIKEVSWEQDTCNKIYALNVLFYKTNNDSQDIKFYYRINPKDTAHYRLNFKDGALRCNPLEGKLANKLIYPEVRDEV